MLAWKDRGVMFLTVTSFFPRPVWILRSRSTVSKVCMPFCIYFFTISPTTYFWLHKHDAQQFACVEEWYKCEWLAKASQHLIYLPLLFWKQLWCAIFLMCIVLYVTLDTMTPLCYMSHLWFWNTVMLSINTQWCGFIPSLSGSL